MKTSEGFVCTTELKLWF